MTTHISELLRDSVDKVAAFELLADMERDLSKMECCDQRIGRWIDEFGLTYLQDVLSSNDEEFAEDYPDMHLTKEEREFLKTRLIEHSSICSHCQLKTDYDARLDEILEGRPGTHHHTSHMIAG